ncbi:MAG: efflux transporter outer membrane subunit [Methylococcales bacterium]|nr:efflux transporter outer membrane subunit [Methylococcales bacterium]
MIARLNPNLIPVLLALALAGCTVGPDYVRPPTTVPVNFKELKGWKQAQPRDNVLHGNWWEVFKDPKLNELEIQVAPANQSLAQAEAQYHQAQHLVQSASSAYLPTSTLSASANRFRAASGQSVAVKGVRNLFNTALSIAWEPDLWGSVRRQVESRENEAQASAATLQALQLSLQATLAANYFQLRIQDELKALLDETVAIYSKTLVITKNRYAVGVVAKTDVVQAETQLESARAQAIDVGVQRAALEHAIAVLIGKTPAAVSIKPEPLTALPPAIPVSLPSELLERRPDIASAERKIAAANAQIGVAKAAFFPSVNLASSTGFQNSTLSTLFTAAGRYWALGPAGAALTLLDGSAKNAQYKQALDGFDASVAAYKQTVLSSFQEVEDNVAALRILEQEALVRDKAVTGARQALSMTDNQYQAGTISYLNVIVAQTVALSNQQAAVELLGERLAASVALVKALGGGWNVTMLPSPDEAGGEVKWTDFLPYPMD